MNSHCVITTINKPTRAIEELYLRFGDNLIVVGDTKTPVGWSFSDATFIPAWRNQNFEFEKYAPNNHYARKNLGYLTAIKNKATIIYDTDDDNLPNDIWKLRTHTVSANESVGKGWFNVYNEFSDEYIWPRGFSLKHLKQYSPCWKKIIKTSSIQQGLSDGEPDVDAIWRLVFKKEILFEVDRSIYLKPNTWCPFNSQSTWWFPKAYPLMYLPVNASFRMTDIWRSFVAQKCLWEIDEGITFHSPAEVFQDRNEHDLLKDFEDEFLGYLKNDTIVEILEQLQLKVGEKYVCENLLTCYKALVDKNILPETEILSVSAWVKDYESIAGNME